MNIPFNDFTIEGIGLNELFDPEDSVGIVSAESMTLRGDMCHAVHIEEYVRYIHAAT